MITIAQLRAAINSNLDAIAGTLGEETDLTNQGDINSVSYTVDSANEIWNENLPTRPTL